MLLLIDNYDSFTYNLFHYFSCRRRIRRNTWSSMFWKSMARAWSIFRS